MFFFQKKTLLPKHQKAKKVINNIRTVAKAQGARLATSPALEFYLGAVVDLAGPPPLEPIPAFSKFAILLVFVAQSTSHRGKSHVGF